MAPAKNNPEITALQAAVLSIDDELKQLQLEEMRESALLRRSKRDQRLRSSEATEASLADSRMQQGMREEQCPHRKGGIGERGLIKGSDNNYSVIVHTLPHGHVIVVCQRCQKIWERPDPRRYAIRANYIQAVKEYRSALEFPTNNVPSGTQLFQLHPLPPPEEMIGDDAEAAA